MADGTIDKTASPLRVLVIGANGFIGTPLLRHLSARGAEVHALHRGQGPAPVLGTIVTCDRNDTDRLRALVDRERFDVVIDVIAMTLTESEPVLEVLRGRIGRYVLISSGDVYRNYEGLHRKASPDPIDVLNEDSPLRVTRYPYRKEDGTALFPNVPPDYDKIPIEDAVRSRTGFDWTVIRVPMVFGPGDRQHRFATLVWRMADQRSHIVLDPPWAHWRGSFGYVDNIAEAIAVISLSPAGAGVTVNVGPNAALTPGQIALRLARIMGWDGSAVMPGAGSAPPDHITSHARRADFRYDLVMGTDLLRNRFGYHDGIPFDEALRMTIEDELHRPRPDGLEAQYEAEDRWLARNPTLDPIIP